MERLRQTHDYITRIPERRIRGLVHTLSSEEKQWVDEIQERMKKLEKLIKHHELMIELEFSNVVKLKCFTKKSA